MCTVEPRYKEVLGITNVFVSPVTVKTVTVTVRTSKKRDLGIANTFFQSLSSSLTQGCVKER